MKDQVLIDFIVKCAIPPTLKNQTSPENHEDNRLWRIYIDGSSNDHRIRPELVMESPDGYSVEHSIRFRFKVSNNAAEHETILTKMDLANTIKTKRILLKSDSKLVVG